MTVTNKKKTNWSKNSVRLALTSFSFSFLLVIFLQFSSVFFSIFVSFFLASRMRRKEDFRFFKLLQHWCPIQRN